MKLKHLQRPSKCRYRFPTPPVPNLVYIRLYKSDVLQEIYKKMSEGVEITDRKQ